jgi:hypothetical protein
MRTESTAGFVGVAIVGVVTAATGLAGCGCSHSVKPKRAGIANTINYGSLGTTATVDCGDGKALNVGGSNNTLTVKGICASVNIVGADNRITVEKIDESLTLSGLDNKVVYKNGAPKIDDHGSGNIVKKD